MMPLHNHSEMSMRDGDDGDDGDESRDSGPMVMGLVVPLVEIGQHFQGHEAKHVIAAIAWKEMAPIKKEPIIRDVMEGRPSPWTRIVTYTERVDIDDLIHDAMTLWLVPCYKLLGGIDKKHCPEPVSKFYMLVKLMLDGARHLQEPVGDWHWNEHHWAKLYSYFRLAIVDIDENLLEIQAKWSE